MVRRGHPWAAYAAANGLGLFLGQFVGALGFANAVFPALTALVAVLEGPNAGGLWGLALGSLAWLSGWGVEYILCCALAGVVAGSLFRRRGFWSCLAGMGLALGLAVGVQVALAFGAGGKLPGLAAVAGREWLGSMVIGALVCPLFLSIRAKGEGR